MYYTSKYKFEYTYWGGMNNGTQGLHLNKPIEPRELKKDVPNLKAIKIEFGKGQFQSKKVDHDLYFNELLDEFDLEEIYIESGNRLTEIPEKLWKSNIKRFSIARYDSDEVFLINPTGSRLSVLELDLNYIKVDNGFWASKYLEEVYIKNVGNGLVNLNPKIRKINFENSNAELTIGFEKFTHLEVLALNNIKLKNKKLSLNNFSSLRSLNLRNLNCHPSSWSELRKLERIYLNNSSLTDPLLIAFEELPSLKNFDISVNQVNSTSFFGKMPLLETFSINIGQQNAFQLSSEVFSSNTLRHVTIGNCKLPVSLQRSQLIEQFMLSNVELEHNEAFLINFERIHISDSDGNSLPKNTQWNKLPNLKSFSATKITDLENINFDENNLALTDVSINYSSGDVPPSWNRCPNLLSIRFNVVNAKGTLAWKDFKSLASISIINCPNLSVPKEIMLWENLTSVFLTSVNNFDSTNALYLDEITKITTDENLHHSAKLILGILLFEDAKSTEQIEDFKDAFLKIFNCKSQLYKQLAWSNIGLINNKKTPLKLTDLVNKSIGILGKTKNNKTYYKDKLKSLESDYKNKIEPQTEIIIVGENFDVPDGFWNHEHRFISEVEAENLLKDHDPGYIQDLDSKELQSLRDLLWSDEAENDRLVLEMIKGGGISEALIPDLIIVAKTSKDNGVKSGLKKILKAKLNEGGQKILSDKTNLRRETYKDPFEIYEKYESDLDISQMALTYAIRLKGSVSGFFKCFFAAAKSEQNPYRKEVFSMVYQDFLEKPHYVTIRWKFSSEEIKFILSRAELQGKLKRVILPSIAFGDIYEALLLHKNTLEDISFSTHEKEMPLGLGNFHKLKNITIYGTKLESLPTDFLDLKKLKELLVYPQQKLKLDPVLKPLVLIKRFYCSTHFEFRE